MSTAILTHNSRLVRPVGEKCIILMVVFTSLGRNQVRKREKERERKRETLPILHERDARSSSTIHVRERDRQASNRFYLLTCTYENYTYTNLT